MGRRICKPAQESFAILIRDGEAAVPDYVAMNAAHKLIEWAKRKQPGIRRAAEAVASGRARKVFHRLTEQGCLTAL